MPETSSNLQGKLRSVFGYRKIWRTLKPHWNEILRANDMKSKYNFIIFRFQAIHQLDDLIGEYPWKLNLIILYNMSAIKNYWRWKCALENLKRVRCIFILAIEIIDVISLAVRWERHTQEINQLKALKKCIWLDFFSLKCRINSLTSIACFYSTFLNNALFF